MNNERKRILKYFREMSNDISDNNNKEAKQISKAKLLLMFVLIIIALGVCMGLAVLLLLPVT